MNSISCKTLIIHPEDKTTEFLCQSYLNVDAEVLTSNHSFSYLKKKIKCSHRVILMGHGTEYGLVGFNKYVISSRMVDVLRKVPELICIWCNADVFVKKYNLETSLHTGMIISELDEAYDNMIYPKTNHISESNLLFARAISLFFEKKEFGDYSSLDNNVIKFNKERVYVNDI